MKKRWAVLTAAILTAASLASCQSSAKEAGNQTTAKETSADGSKQESAEKAAQGAEVSKDAVVISVGFENSMSDPMAQAVEKWKELIEEKSGGSIILELYPDSQLGSKNDLIDTMLLGEKVITIADGAFLSEYGASDLGIVFGPYVFNSWDECWKLQESDWYKGQDQLLQENGLKIVASNWKLGERHLLTVSPVEHPEDLKGMKIRVPNNQVQIESINAIKATATPMAASEVYQALQTKTIDGLENVTSAFYTMQWAEPAKYVYKDAHIYNFAIWVCGSSFFDELTSEQQELLVSTAEEAGVYNNEQQDTTEQEYVDKLTNEMGVTFTEVSAEDKQKLIEMSQSFYDNAASYGWSEGLYDTVMKAMGK